VTAGESLDAVPGLAGYALCLGDDALILAQRLGEWIASAPELEEDVALANIGLDLLGQARALLAYAGQVEGGPTGTPRTEDDLAYLRAEREFRNCQLVEQANGDFGQTIARQLFFSAYQYELYGALAGSRDAHLSAVAAKAVKEVAYHRDHAMAWTVRLGDGTEESHRRMQAGVAALWPYTHELFEADEELRGLVDRGVAVDAAALRPAWEAVVDSVLAEATLARPEDGWHPTGGRRGLHTESFGYLLAEMQHLHRSHPGATW
jgi:ring-1,2-phenylacetyl-CoA epoxidase subunit PaaC